MGCGASLNKGVVEPDTLPPLIEEETTDGLPKRKSPKKTTKIASPTTKQRSKSQSPFHTEEVDSAGSHQGGGSGPIRKGDLIKPSEPGTGIRTIPRKDTPAVLPSLALGTLNTLANPGNLPQNHTAATGTTSSIGTSTKVAGLLDRPPAASMLHPTRKIEGTESQIEFFRKLDEKIEQGPDYVPSKPEKLAVLKENSSRDGSSHDISNEKKAEPS